MTHLLIDSHCHIDGPQYDADREAVLERARAAGVAGFVCIGADHVLDSAPRALALAERHADVWATVGVHPHDAGRMPADGVERVRALAAHPRVVAIGECGLDYHYDHSPRDVQRRVFADFVGLARALDRPLSVHTRAADDDTLAILRAEGARGAGAPVRGVIHCFSHDYAFGRAALDLGFFLSVPGIVTFKKATALREALPRLGPARLMVETDAPFLAPVPHRGQRNEPAFLTATAGEAAALLKIPAEELARVTTANTRACYAL
ncbi:MAG TPA: TatD family hydrolase [Myxococcota bacterium]|nr:TatD family hydrolase [Myxococcota bacterium]